MPRLAGNDQYYNELQIEMDHSGMGMHEAEVNMLRRVIVHMRMVEKKNHAAIAAHLEATWGLTYGAYWTRLKWIREKYVCP